MHPRLSGALDLWLLRESCWVKLRAFFSPQMNPIQPVTDEQMGLEYSLPGDPPVCPHYLEDI